MTKTINLKKSSYSSARISVKRGELYGDEKLKELVNLKFDEILRYLEEHGFRKSVDKAYLQYKGFYLIERVLNDHLSKVYKSVFSGSSKANKILLDSYYLKYQVHNLMVVLRCKLSKEEDFEAYLIGDERRKSKYIKAFEMPNIEDALIYMSKKLKFDDKIVLENYKKGIFELENYLYRQYYEKLKSLKFKYNNSDEKSFFKFIRDYIDLLNARTFLRLKVEEKNALMFEDLFIIGGKLQFDDFDNLNTKNMKEILDFFKIFFGDIDLSLDSLSIDSLDKRISIHKKKSENLFKKANFGSPFYSLRFLFKIEREMGILRVLLKSKHLNLDKEEILNLIK